MFTCLQSALSSSWLTKFLFFLPPPTQVWQDFFQSMQVSLLFAQNCSRIFWLPATKAKVEGAENARQLQTKRLKGAAYAKKYSAEGATKDDYDQSESVGTFAIFSN
jgi:hypothetical protein